MVADDTFVVGYDPGFGNTKVYVAGKAAVLQTAVARSKEVGLAAIGLKTAGRHVPIVEFGGQRFAVGPGAWCLAQRRTADLAGLPGVGCA